jgi:hypothetical protein
MTMLEWKFWMREGRVMATESGISKSAEGLDVGAIVKTWDLSM